MRRYLAVLVMLAGWCVGAMAVDNPPPKDAVFTIYCRSFSGPMKVAEANDARDTLAREVGTKDFHVVHGSQESTLYYGYYRAADLQSEDGKDRKDAERAHADLKKLQGLKDAKGEKLFAMAWLMPIAQNGNEGPPEWNITNAPPDAFWSIMVGCYRDNPQRMKGAVDAVRALREDEGLRKQGLLAYYLHGPYSSLILIGTWPRSAIKEQETDRAVNNDPDEELVVVNTPLPPNAPRRQKLPNGKTRVWISPQVDVQDASLKAALDRYPEFSVNGEVFFRKLEDPKTHLKSDVPDRSCLYIIPRRASSLLGLRNGPKPEALQQVQPGTPPKSGSGRSGLRSLED